MRKLINKITILSIALILIGNNAFTQCNAPTSQPTNLLLTVNSNLVNGVFTASINADHYLIVKSTSSTLNKTPANGKVYSAGDKLGNANVVAYQANTSFTSIDLKSNVLYFYFVIAANSSNCADKPVYLTTNPLTNNIIISNITITPQKQTLGGVQSKNH